MFVATKNVKRHEVRAYVKGFEKKNSSIPRVPKVFKKRTFGTLRFKFQGSNKKKNFGIPQKPNFCQKKFYKAYFCFCSNILLFFPKKNN